MWNPQKAGYLLRNILRSKVVKTNLKGLPYQLCYQLEVGYMCSFRGMEKSDTGDFYKNGPPNGLRGAEEVVYIEGNPVFKRLWIYRLEIERACSSHRVETDREY
ncbi:hypothetical protein TNCV_3820401 [Trichonephila clavipes]|nr:hypothetical protein TNCV_3820401 [Trichonephila clavipes]